MAQLLERVTFPNDKYLLALPNARYPFVLRGRLSMEKIFPISWRWRSFSIWVWIFWGCCGTTPAYIEGFTGGYPAEKKSQTHWHIQERYPSENHVRVLEKAPAETDKRLVELDPPFDLNTEKVLGGRTGRNMMDLLTLSDSPPMARGADGCLPVGKQNSA